jgi:hypothetical protein
VRPTRWREQAARIRHGLRRVWVHRQAILAEYISDDQDDICHAAHEHTTVRWVAAMVRHRADEAWASRKRYEAEYDAFAGDDSVILTWRGPADVHAPEAAERARPRRRFDQGQGL